MTSSVRNRSCLFGPLLLSYDERVLTPRAWTLHQSEWAAQLCANGEPGRILELCAGAGQIGLAAAVLADRDLVQVELDPVAAGYARLNAAQAQWSHRVDIRNALLEQALAPEERFPVIVADPPYLRSADTRRWPEDPVLAIDGGIDGVAVLRACLSLSAQHLTVGGQLLLQVAGPAQAEQITDLLGTGAGHGLVRRGARVIDDTRAIMLLARVA